MIPCHILNVLPEINLDTILTISQFLKILFRVKTAVFVYFILILIVIEFVPFLKSIYL